MNLDAIRAQFSELLTMTGNPPHDRHELYIQLVEELNRLRAFGMPLPDDLVQLEKALENEFASAKKVADQSWGETNPHK